METIFCPFCASGTHHGGAACPVCGTPFGEPCVVEPSLVVPRNPFKLIALCVLWAAGFWFGSLVLLGERIERELGGPLLLVSIGLSIALTVRGVLPGTEKSLRA